MSLIADCYISPRHENGFLLSVSHVLGELSYIGLDGCLPMTFRLSCIVQHFLFSTITASHPQLKLRHNSSLCLRMVKHRRVARPDRVSRRITHQKCLNTKGRSLTAVPASSNTLEQEGFQNPRPPYHSNSASHMTMPMKTFSCQSTSPTLTCSTTSSAIRKATSEELVKSSASLESPQQMSKMSTMDNQQTKPTLLERLSDHALPHQTMEMTSMRKGPTLTMARYHGMSQRT